MSRRRGAKELFIEPDSIGGYVGNVQLRVAGKEGFRSLQSVLLSCRDMEGDRLYLRVNGSDGTIRMVAMDKLLDDLMAFIFEIEKTGGICKRDTDGVMADPEWIDLRDTYLTTCAHLGRIPVFEGKRRLPAKKKHADRNLL